MKKKGTDKPTFLYKDSTKPLSKEEKALVDSFFKKELTEMPKGKVAKYGENLVLISHDIPIPRGSVFSAGVLIGEIRGKNLFPSHQFFSAYGKLFKRQEPLDRIRAEKYIRGEEIAATAFDTQGYCTLTFSGSVIGGGKMSNGTIKNHYPKGLRSN